MSITSRSSSRNGQRVIWIALHTTEGGGTARQLRDADWWTGSSHAIADNTELLTPTEGCVPYDRGSWTLRNGNSKSVNIEQIGYAKWSRDYWLTAQMPMLRNTARWVADVSKRFAVPLEYIGINGVRGNRAGVIQHNDYSQGTGDGSHWDCGPGYPVDVVIDMARGASQPESPPALPTPRESDAMLIFNRYADSRKSTHAFGAENAALLSGGVWVWINPQANKHQLEEAVLKTGAAALWLDDKAWPEAAGQAATLRGEPVTSQDGRDKARTAQ